MDIPPGRPNAPVESGSDSAPEEDFLFVAPAEGLGTSDAVPLSTERDVFGVPMLDHHVKWHYQRRAKDEASRDPEAAANGGEAAAVAGSPGADAAAVAGSPGSDAAEVAGSTPPAEPDAPPPPPVSKDKGKAPMEPPAEVPPPLPPRDPPAPAADEDDQYHLKTIDWWDVDNGGSTRVRIVTQNRNGPCPLIALANVLILRGDLEILPADRPFVTNEHLINLLAERLLMAMESVDTNTDAEDPRRAQDAIDRSAAATLALTHLPSLIHGLDVDVNFMSPRKFTSADSMAVFEAFAVELAHGWVLDPDLAEYWRVVVGRCGGSYNRVTELIAHGDWAGIGMVVEHQPGDGAPPAPPSEGAAEQQQQPADRAEIIRDALIAQQFLEQTASQLTAFGLEMLRDSMPTGGLGVLFRNNHFATMFKHPANDQLYLLVTDAGYLHRSAVVWESLTDIYGRGSQLLDSAFQPIPVEGAEPPRDAEAYPGGQNIDADLALAISLQQQEDAAAAKAEQRRRANKQAQHQAAQQQQQAAAEPPPRHRRHVSSGDADTDKDKCAVM